MLVHINSSPNFSFLTYLGIRLLSVKAKDPVVSTPYCVIAQFSYQISKHSFSVMNVWRESHKIPKTLPSDADSDNDNNGKDPEKTNLGKRKENSQTYRGDELVKTVVHNEETLEEADDEFQEVKRSMSLGLGGKLRSPRSTKKPRSMSLASFKKRKSEKKTYKQPSISLTTTTTVEDVDTTPVVEKSKSTKSLSLPGVKKSKGK